MSQRENYYILTWKKILAVLLVDGMFVVIILLALILTFTQFLFIFMFFTRTNHYKNYCFSLLYISDQSTLLFLTIIFRTVAIVALTVTIKTNRVINISFL